MKTFSTRKADEEKFIEKFLEKRNNFLFLLLFDNPTELSVEVVKQV